MAARFRWFGSPPGAMACCWLCPGCKEIHQITVGGERGWTFTGEREAPTFHPSILTLGTKRCHSMMSGGKMQFMDDCWHELAGKTVEVPELPEEWRD